MGIHWFMSIELIYQKKCTVPSKNMKILNHPLGEAEHLMACLSKLSELSEPLIKYRLSRKIKYIQCK